MHQRLLFAIVTVLALATTAAAAPKKKAKLACTTALDCAKKCSGKAKAACDRLYTVLDERLEGYRTMPDPSYAATYEAARRSLTGACKARHRASCVLLGRLEETGKGGAVDVVAAEKRFETACEAGEPKGCLALGHAHRAGAFGTPQSKLAFSWYQRACSAGDQVGCAYVGSMTIDGVGTTQDLIGGVAALQKACEARGGYACAVLAGVYEYGRTNLPADKVKSRTYREQSCEHGYNPSCTTLGWAVGGDAGVVWHRKACERGAIDACSAAISLTKDNATKDELREISCDLGSTGACKELSWPHREKAPKKYVAYQQRACDLGDESACIAVVTVDLPIVKYDAQNRPIPVDKSHARKIAKVIGKLDGMCKKKRAGACTQLGDLYAYSAMVPRDLAKAKVHYQAACDVRAEKDCWSVKELDRLAAADKEYQACEAGDLDLCTRFGRANYYNEPVRAGAALDKACQAKIVAACAYLARVDISAAYDWDWTGDMGAVGDADLAPLLANCKLGAKDDCYFVLDYGFGTATAAEVGALLCDGGDPMPCANAGRAKATAGDLAGATRLFERGCKLQAGSESCTELDKIAAQRKTADEAAACGKGDPAACMAVAERTADKPAEQLALFDRACAGKHVAACTRAALIRQHGATGVTADPIRARADLEKACSLGAADACVSVAGMWDQVGERDKARAAWVRACEGSAPGSCVQAVALLRDDKQQKDRYRAMLDRGCMLGDSTLCDEAKHGYKAPAPESATSTSSSYDYQPRYTARPKRSRAALVAGAWQLTPDEGALHEGFLGGSVGIDSRARSGYEGVHYLGLVRGALTYDEQSNLGHDVAAGVGIGYGLGRLSLDASGLVGHDGLGEMTATAFGLPSAWYAGYELRATIGAGQWSLTGAYAKLNRQAYEDETRWSVTVDRHRSALIGLGLQGIDYQGASTLGAFLRVAR